MEQFAGRIEVDIRDSVPDWTPFEPPKAPEGSPNVVFITLDDVGFSAMSGYGGPIPTPNIDRISDDGVRYTQFHTTALVLADEVVPAHRPEPHPQQHGVHHGGSRRVSCRERHDPPGERDVVGDLG